MLPLLVQRHPRLSIDARFSDVYVDLVKEGIDVAIRAGTLRDSSLVARTFSSQDLLLIAAPCYLERVGIPTAVAELAQHTAVLFRVPSIGKDRPWHFRVRGRNVTVMPSSRVYVDGSDAIVRAAVLGMGIGQGPHYMVSESLARGELVELLPTMRPPAMPIAAVMPSAHGSGASTRAARTDQGQRRRVPGATTGWRYTDRSKASTHGGVKSLPGVVTIARVIHRRPGDLGAVPTGQANERNRCAPTITWRDHR